MPRLASLTSQALAGVGITRNSAVEGFLFEFNSTGYDELITSASVTNRTNSSISSSSNLGYDAYEYIHPDSMDMDISSYTSNLSGASDIITVEGWMWLDTAPAADKHILGLHRLNNTTGGTFEGDGHHFLYMNSAGNLLYRTSVSGNSSSSLAFSGLTTGAWHHIGFSIYNDDQFSPPQYGKMKIYLNGSAVIKNINSISSDANIPFLRYITFGKWYDWNSLEMSSSDDYGLSQVRVYSGLPSWLPTQLDTTYTVPSAAYSI